jgi:RNAse (barnase) inhibitor barstar
MINWLDLKKIIPGLSKGQWLHVVNSPLNPLVNTLAENGFSVFVIDGSEITDSGSFFQQAKKVFGFPDYFGKNWDAWNDCLGDFELSLKGKTAIIWDDADKTFISDTKTFIQAVFDLHNLALSAGYIDKPNPCQVELFLVGKTEGFKNVLDFKGE